jgi:hypothetical protein
VDDARGKNKRLSSSVSHHSLIPRLIPRIHGDSSFWRSIGKSAEAEHFVSMIPSEPELGSVLRDSVKEVLPGKE